jgi:L,D-transpeptidase ErfK/SrfK
VVAEIIEFDDFVHARARRRAAGRVLAGVAVLAATLTAGCGVWRRGAPVPTHPEKITMLHVHVPLAEAAPELVGRMQRHRVVAGETLLDIARDAGLGFHELRDANPTIDEWTPAVGADLVVPSRWILPRSRSRGLVVNIPEMRLYKFPVDTRPGEVVPIRTWAVGIGTEEAPTPVGPLRVRSKDENPTWIVPASIYRAMEEKRRVVPPGPDNPLGAYRIRLSKGAYAIHGTNNPWSIGRLTTHGCVRLYPEDIAELYPTVRPGMPAELVYQPVKLGVSDGRVYAEIHDDVYGRIPDLEAYARAEVRRVGLDDRVDVDRLREAVRARSGVPVAVGPGVPADADTDASR